MEPAVAGRLGADVPFCLHGGRAQVSGVGEVVDPRPDEFIGGSYLVVTPRVQVSTAVVYGTWDEMGRPTGDFDNDLEPAALTAYPEIRWWRDLMAAAVGERPRLAGSGGSWFIEGDSQKLRELAAGIRGEIVAARESALVVVTQSVPRILTAVPGS
jgi:4-diphosphocytidyl-2-C-methyl-D-erythritol kinase